MATSQTTVRKSAPAKAAAPAAARPKTAAQEALEITWVLKGHLKNVQIAYLRAGMLLSRVRDKKLYAALDHPDMEGYAEKRLGLSRTAMYQYLQVYDWAREFHKEWLEPKPAGFIPNLTDVTDLMRIERELARPDVSAPKKAALTELRQKALAGKLQDGDLAKVRSQRTGSRQGLKAFLSRLRLLRRQGAQLAGMPADAIQGIDTAIASIGNAVAATTPERETGTA